MSTSVFFCSNIIPTEINNYITSTSQRSAALAGNIYCNAIIHGLLENNCNVSIICSIDREEIKTSKEKYKGRTDVHFLSKKSNGIMDYLSMCYHTFCDVMRFGRKYKKDKHYVFFDVMRPSTCIGGLIAAKIRHIPTLGIVMDVPSFRVEEEVSAIIDKLANRISKTLLGTYDMYLLLSEEMKTVIPHISKKAALVMEGIYELPDCQIETSIEKKTDNKEYTIMYAGSLYYEYGIMNLVEAVRQINDRDIRLIIFGRGNAENEIISIGKNDSRISYEGLISHDEIIKREATADLLVNPRPVDKDYVSYSFPSKTMEYMASGTPLIMADIPSLPDEYRQYIYLIQDNSIENIKDAIIYVKGVGRNEAIEKALNASDFIIHKKNHRIQCKQILNFVEKTAGN